MPLSLCLLLLQGDLSIFLSRINDEISDWRELIGLPEAAPSRGEWLGNIELWEVRCSLRSSLKGEGLGRGRGKA